MLCLSAVQFFCVVAVVAYAVDGYYQIVDIRRKFIERQTSSRDMHGDVPIAE